MAFIAYRNRADSATLSVEGGSVLPGHPLTNLQIRESDSSCIIDGGVVHRLIADLGSPSALRFIGLFGTNRPIVSGVSIHGSANASSWTLINSFSNPAVDHSGTPVPLDLKLFSQATPAAYRYWRVSWTPWTGSGGISRACRLWMSAAQDMVDFPEGVDATWSPNVLDLSVSDRTASGLYYADPQAVLRTLAYTLTSKNTDKAFGFSDGDASIEAVTASIQAMQLVAGGTGEVVAAMRRDPLWLHRTCIRGSFDGRPPTLKHARGIYWDSTGQVLEEP